LVPITACSMLMVPIFVPLPVAIVLGAEAAGADGAEGKPVDEPAALGALAV